MGFPGALVLGVLAGLFTLVPDVGPFLAAALATAVALLEGSTWIPLSNFWVAGITVLVYLVLIGMKNFFLRPIVMGRSVHMNEALVFIIIMIATILEGIPRCAFDRASLCIHDCRPGIYPEKILGQSAFEDDGKNQFVMPDEPAAPGRKWGRRATDLNEDALPPGTSPVGEATSALANEAQPDLNRRVTDRQQDAPDLSAGPESVMDEDSSSMQMPAQKKE